MSRQSIFAGKVVKHNRVILSAKAIKRTGVVARTLEEIGRTKLVGTVNKRRSNKVEMHNALKR